MKKKIIETYEKIIICYVNSEDSIYDEMLDNFDEDYKASFLTALDFTVNDNFKISLQYSTFYDSSPPILAVRHDEQISTNFSYSF